jgi:ABC-type polysaccharide/polyol phosphate export permease
MRSGAGGFRSFQDMLANLLRVWRSRALIASLVSRELKARYRGSVLGFFWSFLNPLLLLTVYTVVFTYVLGGSRGPQVEPYGVFMFCGLLPWLWFQSSLLEATSSLIVGGNLIKKIPFPAEVLPLVSVLSNAVHFLLGLPILIVFLFLFHHPLTMSALLFPLVVVNQLVLTTGLALLVAALGVHFRDVRDLLSNLLTLWFFCTPIIYPYSFSALPEPFRRVLDLNPLTHLVMGFQSTLFYGELFRYKRLSVTFLVGLAAFWCGYFVFDRLRDSFAEEV